MFKWLSFVWLMNNVFTLYGGGKGGADAPDYTQIAAASEKAAVLGKELGDAQLAENKRQYDQNIAISTPVVAAQLGIANQTAAQGADYYDYAKQNGRPVENQLMYEAMGYTPEEVAQIMASQSRETAAYNTAIQSKQQAAADAINNAPDTYTTKYQDNAIKGSDIVGLINGKPAVPAGRYVGGMGGISMGLTGTGLDNRGSPAVAGVAANPDAYYIKSADGSYTEVAGTKTKDERKLATVDDPSTYGSADTPETDILKSQIGMAASKRMADADAAERGNIENLNTDLATRIGESDTQVYERNKGDIEAEAGMAAADQRNGYTNAMNIAARQGLRYGFAPNKLGANAASAAIGNASAQAAAMNGTRKTAVQTMYGRGIGKAQQLVGGATTARAMGQQDKSIATAKKLDVAGLYRGLPSASSGAYGNAIAAGNSAVNNQMQPSNTYMENIAAANGTTMQGAGLNIQGQSAILNSKTSIANANSGDDGSMGMLGTVAGAGIAAF